MSALVRCKECLMPTTRPDTAFVDGVCSACIAYKRRKEIDWDARKEDLLKVLESAKPNAEGYNCVVPASAGKDSHYQVIKLLELGAKPLVVIAGTCMLSDIGAANIRNLARYADLIEAVPNLRVRAILNRLGLELVGDISWPEHVSVFSVPWRIAKAHGLNLLFYGESSTVEYGGPMDTLSIGEMNRRWITEFGQHNGLRPSDLVGSHGLRREDMAYYQMPAEADMANMKAYFLGHFIPWNSHHNARVAVGAGMQAEIPTPGNWFHAENLDNLQTGLHDYFGWLKFAYGRLCAQISIDIRYGMISRGEAADIVMERDGQFPELYLRCHYKHVLQHIGVTEERFWQLAKQYANVDLFDTSGERPGIRKDVWAASF